MFFHCVIFAFNLIFVEIMREKNWGCLQLTCKGLFFKKLFERHCNAKKNECHVLYLQKTNFMLNFCPHKVFLRFEKTRSDHEFYFWKCLFTSHKPVLQSNHLFFFCLNRYFSLWQGKRRNSGKIPVYVVDAEISSKKWEEFVCNLLKPSTLIFKISSYTDSQLKYRAFWIFQRQSSPIFNGRRRKFFWEMSF